MEHIDRAAQACGGLAKLAGLLGESVQTVSNWRSRGIPLVKCSLIEAASNGAITRRDMRPDDWHLVWPELVTAEHPAPMVPPSAPTELSAITAQG